MAISVYQLKPAFIRLLRPLAAGLVKAGATANQVTLAACGVSVLYAGVLFMRPDSALLWALMPVWLFLRMALNAIDGIMAREFSQKSRLGALLNETGDVVADAALYAPFALLPGVHVQAVALFVWMALLTEFAGVLAVMVNAPRRYDGPLGKSDRAFILGLAAVLCACALAWDWRIAFILNAVFYGCSGLMAWTAFNRLRGALAGGSA